MTTDLIKGGMGETGSVGGGRGVSPFFLLLQLTPFVSNARAPDN